jgi:hypothetical protein
MIHDTQYGVKKTRGRRGMVLLSSYVMRQPAEQDRTGNGEFIGRITREMEYERLREA